MFAFASTVGFLLAPTVGAQIAVGPNVQVSVAQSKYPMGEVLLSADPKDPNHLLGCGIVYSEVGIRRWTAVYLSTDGGKTWSTTLETKKWYDSADPACTVGLNGVANHVALAWQNPKLYVLAVYRSTDGGRTWQEQQPMPMQFQGIVCESIVADIRRRHREAVSTPGSSRRNARAHRRAARGTARRRPRGRLRCRFRWCPIK